MPVTSAMLGLADPVHDGQRAFRAVLDALANPGTVQTLPLPQATPPQLGAQAASVLLTLADYETPVWLSPGFDHRAVREYTRFHTGSPLTSEPEHASFLFVANEREMPSPARLNIGEEDYPDRSSTLVIAVDGFNQDHLLAGPGIDSTIRFGAAGLGEKFWALARDNHTLYPLGVDFLFTCVEGIAGLPRSTCIEG